MEVENHKIGKVYVPNILIFRNRIYKIITIAPKFTIKGYIIKTVDNLIDMVILSNPHPNANPKSGDFCIPPYIRNLKLNEKSLGVIENMLRCFNLDDCYFTPWSEIKYRKQEVIGEWKTKNN